MTPKMWICHVSRGTEHPALFLDERTRGHNRSRNDYAFTVWGFLGLETIGRRRDDLHEHFLCLDGNHGICSVDEKEVSLLLHSLRHELAAHKRLYFLFLSLKPDSSGTLYPCTHLFFAIKHHKDWYLMDWFLGYVGVCLLWHCISSLFGLH